jgi:hypothetical protein
MISDTLLPVTGINGNLYNISHYLITFFSFLLICCTFKLYLYLAQSQFHLVPVKPCSYPQNVCGSFPHERQSTADVRCYATACWFHFHCNQQYVTTQQYCNALLVGFSVGRSIRNSPLLCNGWRNCEVTRVVFSGSVKSPKLGSTPRYTDWLTVTHIDWHKQRSTWPRSAVKV